MTADRTARDQVRAQLRVLAKRLLRTRGYPATQEEGKRTVLERVERNSAERVAA